MVKRPDKAQLDLFVAYLTDLPLRDQRDTMERPFFSLSKTKRTVPIEYQAGLMRASPRSGTRIF